MCFWHFAPSRRTKSRANAKKRRESMRSAPGIARRREPGQRFGDQALEFRMAVQRFEVRVVLDVAVLAEAQAEALGQLSEGHVAFAAEGVEARRLDEVRGLVVGETRRLAGLLAEPDARTGQEARG